MRHSVTSDHHVRWHCTKDQTTRKQTVHRSFRNEHIYPAVVSTAHKPSTSMPLLQLVQTLICYRVEPWTDSDQLRTLSTNRRGMWWRKGVLDIPRFIIYDHDQSISLPGARRRLEFRLSCITKPRARFCRPPPRDKINAIKVGTM